MSTYIKIYGDDDYILDFRYNKDFKYMRHLDTKSYDTKYLINIFEKEIEHCIKNNINYHEIEDYKDYINNEDEYFVLID